GAGGAVVVSVTGSVSLSGWSARVRRAGGRGHAGASTTAAFWPPKANEHVRTGPRGMARGPPVTTSISSPGSGWSQLTVGVTWPARIDRTASTDSTAPAPPMRWPMAPLAEVTGTPWGPKTLARAAA